MTREGGPLSNNNQPIKQLLPSLPPSTQTIQNTFSYILHHSVTYTLHPLSQQQCHVSILVHSAKFIQPLTVPTIPHTSSNILTVPADHSQILHNQEMNHIFPCSVITHYTPLVTYHSTSLLILQQISWTSAQPEQQPHTLLTLYQPHIFSNPVLSFLFRIYFFFPVLPISCRNLFLLYLPTNTPHQVQTFSTKPHTLPITLFLHPLWLSPPPSSSVDFLPSLPISYQTTFSISSLLFSSTLFLLARQLLLLYCFPSTIFYPLSSVSTPASCSTTTSWQPNFCCMLHTRYRYKLPHYPSSINFHLSIHPGHPHHLSIPLFCLIHHLL